MTISFEGHKKRTGKVRVWRHTKKYFGNLAELLRRRWCGTYPPTHSNRSNVGASGGAWTSKSLEMGTFLSKWHQQPLFPWPSISNTARQLWERREGYNSHFCQFAYLWSPSSPPPPPPRSSSSHSSLACFHTVFETLNKCLIIYYFLTKQKSVKIANLTSYQCYKTSQFQ